MQTLLTLMLGLYHVRSHTENAVTYDRNTLTSAHQDDIRKMLRFLQYTVNKNKIIL